MKIKKSIYIILMILTLSLGNFSTIGTNVEAKSSTVYVTQTGKRYFYDPNDKGLIHAKKLYTMSESEAKSKGFTLSMTEGGSQNANKYITHDYYKVGHKKYHY